MNNLYIGMNGKLHYLLGKVAEIEAELNRQIEEDNYIATGVKYFVPYTGE